jgi:putative glutamine amidotransferase
MQKLIGLTSRVLVETNIEKQFVNTRYLTPLHERGFNTIMLTLSSPNPESVFDLCDGFLVTGGVDLNPETYGENNSGLSKGVDDRLDLLDQQVILYAKAHGKPLLGICRGHQSLNVFMGGSLIQDLNSLDKYHEHISKDHIIHTSSNRLLPLDQNISVNSFHHQAVKKIAPEFDVIARYSDDTIEAMIHRHLPMISVQWHPEANPESTVSQIVFDAFASMLK